MSDRSVWRLEDEVDRLRDEVARLRLTDAERELLRACETDYKEAACRMDEHHQHGSACALLKRSIAIGGLLERLGGER